MHKILFTSAFCQPENLHPFTLTRQVQDIRVGILTIREKWEKMLKQVEKENTGNCILVNASVLPDLSIVKAIKKLKKDQFLATSSGITIACSIAAQNISTLPKAEQENTVLFEGEVNAINYPWDIFHLNDWAIREDFNLLTAKRKSQKISKTNRVEKPSQIFIEKGAKVEHAIINALTGPVYIGKNAEIMDGCIIRGPFAMNEDACLKLGTKVYGATTLGPKCVVGGEIKNSVLIGFSNKAHDGYLGDSVIGEWCNMGAGTTNSNLKNNVSNVNVWMPKGEMNAGIKCGVLMGDYSRTAVNTAINTGTVIGVCCNVFAAGLTPKHIPNFSWGSDGAIRYEFDKAVTDINGWKGLKGKTITEDEKNTLKTLFDKN
jgi:UDP-N-acetylglucosamine diphosphorylase / glucose-1-phosphate thymidylyltransferase / UDP-N-acetylgalactosamine diphosphorylase / glucosamine-1-phosphate N-acetyltransferase / galactosamine-1-phosphate N-acetyltransferase